MFLTLEVMLKCLPMSAGHTHVSVALAGIEGTAQVGNTWLLECFTKENKCSKVSGVCVCFFAGYSQFVVCPRINCH